MKNYNPNKSYNDIHEVELTFQQWDYKKVVKVEMKNNLRGYSVANHAIDMVLDDLPVKKFINDDGDEDSMPYITLVNDKGAELECTDEENRWDEWLEQMLVKFEITSLKYNM